MTLEFSINTEEYGTVDVTHVYVDRYHEPGVGYRFDIRYRTIDANGNDVNLESDTYYDGIIVQHILDMYYDQGGYGYDY